MKKYGLWIFIMICFVIVGVGHERVNADEFSFSVHAEPSVVDATGENVKIKFMVDAGNNTITNCEFKVSAPSGVQFVEDESPNGWNIDTGANGYLLDSSDGVSQGVIMNSIYKVNSDSTITISNVKCGNAEKDEMYNLDKDITVDVKIADVVNIKVDGVVVGGGVANPLASSKNSFVLSVTSADTSIQGNVKVELADTVTGTKQICLGDECKEITVNFSNDNFCDSVNCKDLKPQLGDNIQVNVYVGSTLDKSFYVIREIGEEVKPVNPTLKYLKVWGYEIELVEGQTVYPLNVPANVTDYSVVAELSDPDNFLWDEEDNPSKYNFKTDTINLRLIPKDYEALGAREEMYVVVITQDGDGNTTPPPSSSSSTPSNSSSNKPASSSSNNNSNNNNVTNPQTSGISQFIVAIILFVSLGSVLSLYKKYMEEYR